MYQDSEREFVVTHNANIKPVSYFTGRETELRELRQRVEEGRKSVLVSGMGGIGKTHICRKLFEEYLNKHADGANCPFMHIGYIEYSGDMGSSLQSCLKFKQQEKSEQNQEAAWKEMEYLASDGKLLLFVDNVDRPIGEDSGLQRLKGIPGAVVLTSRQASFSDEFEPYRIGFLGMEQCKEIYEKIRFEGSDRKVDLEEIEDLEYVIESLAGRHTITVELLAHLARTKLWTVKRLREELEQKGFRLTFRKNGELVNIQESYEKLYDLSELTEAEQNILEVFSVFPYIPLAAETCNEWLLADAGVREDDDILMGLYQKGWLQFDIDQESYSMHPVFAQFIYEKCRPKLEKHLGLIEKCQKKLKVSESGFALENQNYIPFAENMIENLGMGKGEEPVKFIYDIAYLLEYIAEYKRSLKWYKLSLKICEDVWGENHPNTANCYNNVAGLYQKQGEYEKARELYDKGLKIYDEVLGENNPDTIKIAFNLADLFREQGSYVKAKELYEKNLKIQEVILGKNHPDTATGYNNVAAVYECQGEYEKAKELYEKSLRIRESVLGDKHPDTAISYSNLAGVYQCCGEYEKAKELYEKSLQVRENALGQNHPDTAISYNNLAEVYKSQGEYDEAEELYKKSLKIQEVVLGKNHPDTATSYNNLAGVYRKRGKFKKAEELYKKSLRIQEVVLGKNHPDTAISYNNLAGICMDQEMYEKAEELFKKSLSVLKSVLGENHPDAAVIYNNLGLLYIYQEKYQRALDYLVKAYKIWVATFGWNHLHTSTAYKNMEIAYSKRNPEGNFNQWLEEKMKE